MISATREVYPHSSQARQTVGRSRSSFGRAPEEQSLYLGRGFKVTVRQSSPPQQRCPPGNSWDSLQGQGLDFEVLDGFKFLLCPRDIGLEKRDVLPHQIAIGPHRGKRRSGIP